MGGGAGEDNPTETAMHTDTWQGYNCLLLQGMGSAMHV